MKMYRLAVYVVDHEETGLEGVVNEIEACKYSMPTVVETATTEIGEWHDGIDINQGGVGAGVFDAYFTRPPAEIPWQVQRAMTKLWAAAREALNIGEDLAINERIEQYGDALQRIVLMCGGVLDPDMGEGVDSKGICEGCMHFDPSTFMHGCTPGSCRARNGLAIPVGGAYAGWCPLPGKSTRLDLLYGRHDMLAERVRFLEDEQELADGPSALEAMTRERDMIAAHAEELSGYLKDLIPANRKLSIAVSKGTLNGLADILEVASAAVAIDDYTDGQAAAAYCDALLRIVKMCGGEG